MGGREEKSSGCFFLAGGRGGGRGYERGEGAPYRGIPFSGGIHRETHPKSIHLKVHFYLLHLARLKEKPLTSRLRSKRFRLDLKAKLLISEVTWWVIRLHVLVCFPSPLYPEVSASCSANRRTPKRSFCLGVQSIRSEPRGVE